MYKHEHLVWQMFVQSHRKNKTQRRGILLSLHIRIFIVSNLFLVERVYSSALHYKTTRALRCISTKRSDCADWRQPTTKLNELETENIESNLLRQKARQIRIHIEFNILLMPETQEDRERGDSVILSFPFHVFIYLRRTHSERRRSAPNKMPFYRNDIFFTLFAW